MLFNEIYSAYYNTISKILSSVLEGKNDDETLRKIVEQNAFYDSVLTILPSLREEKWQLLAGKSTPIKHLPTTPVSTLEKRWLKAVLQDERVKLFDVKIDGLEGVKPLFSSEDYLVYDKYADGDPYDDENYVRLFRFMLSAIKEKRTVEVVMKNAYDKKRALTCLPLKMEYSEKDDKFRVIVALGGKTIVVNMARIIDVKNSDKEIIQGGVRQQRVLKLRIIDNRNALERVMLHFAHFEKNAVKTGKKEYMADIKYDIADEPEIVMRVLSFGPMVEVIAPESVRNTIIKKLKRQLICDLK